MADTPLPFTEYQYVTATFPAADSDLIITHQLSAERDTDVVAVPVASSAAASIYQSPTTPGSRTYVVLRASAPTTATLLLLLRSRDQLGTPR